MTERDVTVVKKDGKTEPGKLTQAQMEATMTREQKKALRARILERGIVADRTIVELPPEYHYEWVPVGGAGETSVDRKRLLGFWIDGEGGHPMFFKGELRALHSDGTKVPMVGDCVLMITTRENKELIDEINRENYFKQHGKPGITTTEQREERKYRERVEGAGLPTPVIEESQAKTIQRQELEEILKPKE